MFRFQLRRAVAAALCCLTLSLTAFSAGPRLSMSYLYYTGGDSAAVASAEGALNEVSPAWFELTADGSLKVSSAASRTFVNEMHAQGIRVVPFLSNHWDREVGAAALRNADTLTDQLARAVTQYNLDGVSLDLENMTKDHAAAYTNLTAMLRRKLPKGKTIAVAVAANPRNFTTGWHASYDYKGLAQHADYLMVMAYDEHYRGSEPGAVAGLDFVENSIRYALRYAEPEQIVLGVPFYGRIWGDGNAKVNGVGISEKQTRELVRRYGGTVTYDKTAGTAVARFTVNDGGVTVAGIPLQKGKYTVYYADETAKKEILRLVNEYDLRGTGSWSLGQETGEVWDYYSLWLNGCYFEDLQGHWARNYVVEVSSWDVVNGVSETSFAPDRTLTRAQAAALLVRLLDLPTGGETPFSDTKGHWASAEIAAAARAGLVEGVGEGLFAPNSSVTREQLAVLLFRAARYRGDDTGKRSSLTAFSDGTTASSWAREALSWAVAMGLMEGSGGMLPPRAHATRAQTTAILCRMGK